MENTRSSYNARASANTAATEAMMGLTAAPAPVYTGRDEEVVLEALMAPTNELDGLVGHAPDELFAAVGHGAALLAEEYVHASQGAVAHIVTVTVAASQTDDVNAAGETAAGLVWTGDTSSDVAELCQTEETAEIV